jgi:hypothetical protein
MATYWWEDGMLISKSKSVLRTVALLRENAELVHELTGGRPVPLLIYLADSPVPGKDAREYSTRLLPKLYSAMAMVSKPGLAMLIMKLLFRLQSPPIPMKQFTDAASAKAWLRSLAIAKEAG